MTRIARGLVFVCLCIVASPSFAQDALGTGAAPAWQVSLDFLSIATRGNDVHVGDVFTQRQAVSSIGGGSQLDYGVSSRQILTQMRDDQSFVAAVRYRRVRWAFGLQAGRIVSDGDAQGVVASEPPTATSQAVTGVRMWENSIVPVNDQREPSGMSPVSYDAANRLESMRIQGYAERHWGPDGDLSLAFRVGLAYARVENSRSEGQTQRAFLQQVTGNLSTTFTNAITLRGESETAANLLGAVFGLRGEWRLGRFQVDWLTAQSILRGTADSAGEWIDIDDSTTLTVSPGLSVQTRDVLSGSHPLEREERVIVPVLDLEAKLSLRIAGPLSVGGGISSSTWFNLPVASNFEIPDDWTGVQGTGWRQGKRDITYSGFSAFARIGF